MATVITVLAMGLSVACGGILLRLNQLSESRFASMGRGGDAVVGAKAGGIEILLGSLNGEGDYPAFLPMKLFESLRAEQAVTHSDGTTTRPSYISSIIPFVYFGRVGEKRVVGTDASFFKRPREEDSLAFASGREFAGGEGSTGEIVLGAAVAAAQGLNVGDKIKVHPWVGGEPLSSEKEFRVVGILSPTHTEWDRLLYASIGDAFQTFQENFVTVAPRSIWGPRVLNYFLVYLRPSGFAPLEALINRRTVGQVVGVEEQKARLAELSGVGKRVGWFVMIFVIVLGGLSVGSMLTSRFEGMSLQIAVLRALGYTRNELTRWLVWEGLLLGMLGVAVGALVDAAGLPILRAQLGSALPPPELVSSPLWQSELVWIMALAATVTAVLLPVWKMSRQDIHRSLRN
jgi:hypothetical protein